MIEYFGEAFKAILGAWCRTLLHGKHSINKEQLNQRCFPQDKHSKFPPSQLKGYTSQCKIAFHILFPCKSKTAGLVATTAYPNIIVRICKRNSICPKTSFAHYLKYFKSNQNWFFFLRDINIFWHSEGLKTKQST